MRLIWVQGWPSRIPKFHHKDLDFETKNGSWPKKMTLRKKQTKHHFTSFHSNSRNFMDLIHLRFSTLVVNPRPSERPALPQSSCWKNHHVINRFTHLKNDLMPPSCGLSLRRTSMNWSEWTWHQVTPQHISRNTYAITCIPFYVHMYMYMYIMYMHTYAYMYTCMYM